MKGLVVLLSIACLLPNVPLDARAQQARSNSFTAAGSAGSRVSSDQAGKREYLIGPEDLLVINVWKEPELSRTVPVRPDGKISLPLVEDIQATGLTPIQLARAIETKLKRFITKPATTVIVQKSNSHHVYLMGQVARPGAYPLVPEMTVLQALATAGGISGIRGREGHFCVADGRGREREIPFQLQESNPRKAAGPKYPLAQRGHHRCAIGLA